MREGMGERMRTNASYLDVRERVSARRPCTVVGNAFARELRRMKRFEEAALVFTAVAKLGQEDEADTRDFALAALWAGAGNPQP